VIRDWQGTAPTPAQLEKILASGRAKVAGPFYYCLDCRPENVLHFDWHDKHPRTAVVLEKTAVVAGYVCDWCRMARVLGPKSFSAPRTNAQDRPRIAPEVA
jgi:hypothetical protein